MEESTSADHAGIMLYALEKIQIAQAKIDLSLIEGYSFSGMPDMFLPFGREARPFLENEMDIVKEKLFLAHADEVSMDESALAVSLYGSVVLTKVAERYNDYVTLVDDLCEDEMEPEEREMLFCYLEKKIQETLSDTETLCAQNYIDACSRSGLTKRTAETAAHYLYGQRFDSFRAMGFQF